MKIDKIIIESIDKDEGRHTHTDEGARFGRANQVEVRIRESMCV